MKKNSIAKQTVKKPRHRKTSTARQAERRSSAGMVKQVVGLDLGDKSSRYCVLDSEGIVQVERGHDTARVHAGVCQDGPQPDRAGGGDAFAVGEPAAGKPRARSDRGQRPAGTDH